MALFMTFVGRVLVGKRRRTRRCVSVDSSLLPALDVRVKARPLARQSSTNAGNTTRRCESIVPEVF